MRIIIRAMVAVALVAAGPACSGPKRSAAIPEPVGREIDGLGNARAVGEDLLFGAQPTPEALAALAAQGYRTVLTTRGDGELEWDERALVDSLGMRFVSIPMPNPLSEIPDAWVEQFDALMRDAGRPMLLHCSSGNRVAGLWAVWLAERQGVEPAQALELGEKAGMTRIRPLVETRLGASGGG